MTKSWWKERYPPHECQTCSLEHIKIPGIKLRVPGSDEPEPLYPFEVIGDDSGTIHPGRELKGLDTPGKIVGLSWGLPGSTEVLLESALWMN